MIELTQLRYFHEVAKTGGFTKAARIAHVQQPAISRAVRLLEAQLGVTLFVRGKRGVTLTKVGREVFDLSQEVMRLLTAIEVHAQNQQDAISGPLKFAAQSAVAAGLVPAVNAIMLARHPKVWPMTHTITVNAAVDLLLRAELEFGIFYHLPTQRRRDLVIEHLADESFALVVGGAHARDRKTVTSFIGSREIEDEGTRKYPTLLRLQRDYPEATIRISCNDAAAQKQMALRGLGVAVLPRSLVEAELRAGSLKELYAKKLSFPLYAFRRRGHPLSRGAEIYLEEARRLAKA